MIAAALEAHPAVAQRTPRLGPGVSVVLGGVGGAWIAHQLIGAVGVLTWAVALGVLAANLGLVPRSAEPGIRRATRPTLRLGVVLLGFSLSLTAIAALGPAVIALVVATSCLTLVATALIGLRLGLGRSRALLVATGFSICGAAAIAGMQENAEADEDDVAVSVAMVTLWGTLAMVALPLVQAPLGLDELQYGVWAGASIHEVGQVVAAAGAVGPAALAIATVVKLTRVLMLAPLVAAVGVARRHEARLRGDDPAATQLPPLVPAFVLGFLGCALVRSTGLLPAELLDVVVVAQTLVLAAALFCMGTAVRIGAIIRGSRPVLLLSGISTLIIAGASYAWIALVV